MKTKVLLIRHGETEWNKTLRFQGSINIPLCQEGIEQAKLLEKKLGGSFDCAFASPLDRAYETANILCKNTSIKPILVSELREIDFGAWEGHNMDTIKEIYPKEYEIWRNDEEVGNFMGGDKSIKEVSIRAKEAILNIVKENSGKTILIVAHGGIIKAGLIGLFGWKMTMYHRFFIGNTSVTTLSFQDNLEPFLLELNNTSHLIP